VQEDLRQKSGQQIFGNSVVQFRAKLMCFFLKKSCHQVAVLFVLLDMPRAKKQARLLINARSRILLNIVESKRLEEK
jgi:hypothetical protein